MIPEGKINAEKFIEALVLDIADHAFPFESNMDHLRMEDREYDEWLKVFIAWMEWLDD